MKAVINDYHMPFTIPFTFLNYNTPYGNLSKKKVKICVYQGDKYGDIIKNFDHEPHEPSRKNHDFCIEIRAFLTLILRRNSRFFASSHTCVYIRRFLVFECFVVNISFVLHVSKWIYIHQTLYCIKIKSCYFLNKLGCKRQVLHIRAHNSG